MRRLLAATAAAATLLLTCQVETDEPWDYGTRAVVPTSVATSAPLPTATPDDGLREVYATAIAAATERAGRPTRTPYPTYVPIPTPDPTGNITSRYSAYIAQVAAKLGIPDPDVTIVDYNHSALAQAAISPARLAVNPDLEAFYIPKANVIALVTEASQVVDNYILWHEVSHAIHNMLGAPNCEHTIVGSEEEVFCNHNREFLYLEKAVWGAFNLVRGRDVNFGTVDDCAEAMALGQQGVGRAFVRKGEVGSGVGFSIVYVRNAPDPDGDGVVCETDGS